MNEILLASAVALLIAVVTLQVFALRRSGSLDLSQLDAAFASVEKACDRAERAVREEISENREESSSAARLSREELTSALKGVGDSLNRQVMAFTQTNDQKLDRLREAVEQRLQVIQDRGAQKLEEVRQYSMAAAKAQREELSSSLKAFSDSVLKGMAGMADAQQKQMEAFSSQLKQVIESNQQKSDVLRAVVEEKLKSIQEDNAKQLEQMRLTVDEKLHGTLEKRLGESFKQVSDRLEAVYKGLGEMQTLAAGVGDLKKMLTNVKIRGTWGEVQLGALLEQVLNPDQYAVNVATRDGGERVEFAIKLPGREADTGEVVGLPIDAKFPVEDYQRLVEAQERADPAAAEAAAKQLENQVRGSAKDICGKYLNPPKTTDFGILFLPVEGLFSEVIRRPGLIEVVQRECRVVIAGPTTLWSILNSLQMGFRTLAIQKRSSDVWNLLAAVKTEWAKYGEALGKVQQKLHEASDTIDKAQTRTRAIGRKLKGVQELPASEAQAVLLLDATAPDAGGGAEDLDS